MSASPYRFQLSPRLFLGENKCFGPGTAQLLEGVDRLGSLRSAAAEMGMAYSKAWTVLRGCEQALGFSLLERSVGGRKGGHSRLTPEAHTLLSGFRRAEQALYEAGRGILDELLPGGGAESCAPFSGKD